MTEAPILAVTTARPLEVGDLRLIGDALPHMVWSTRPDGFHDYYNARWYEFTGAPAGSTDGEAWNGMFHPDDQARAWEVWRHSLATGAPYRIEYRLRHHSGSYRWTIGSAVPVLDPSGSILRWIGTCTDIDDSRRLAEQNSLLSEELGHRIKNLFAVVGSVVHQSLKPHIALRKVAAELQERIAALGRAHEFVRPRDEVATSRSLSDLLAELLKPYPAFDEGRVEIVSDSFDILTEAVTPLALAIHELATNATKYGALSNETGHVELGVRADATTVSLHWREQGVGAVGRPASFGFGTGLIDIAVTRQLGGSIERDWSAHGLQVKMAIPRTRLLS